MGGKIRCVIVDDEQHAIDLLKYHLAKVDFLELLFETRNPLHAFEFLKRNTVDLLFLDIQMNELNGLELLKLIDNSCKVILTTAYAEHALESYEYGVVDYLLKPITFGRFLKAVQKIELKPTDEVPAGKETTLAQGAFFVKSGARNMLVRVDLEELLYVESQGNYVFFHLEKEKIRSLITLKRVEEELADHPFIRIHQSFLVARRHIRVIDGNGLVINGKSLPIGEKYREAVKRDLLNRTI